MKKIKRIWFLTMMLPTLCSAQLPEDVKRDLGQLTDFHGRGFQAEYVVRYYSPSESTVPTDSVTVFLCGKDSSYYCSFQDYEVIQSNGYHVELDNGAQTMAVLKGQRPLSQWDMQNLSVWSENNAIEQVKVVNGLVSYLNTSLHLNHSLCEYFNHLQFCYGTAMTEHLLGIAYNPCEQLTCDTCNRLFALVHEYYENNRGPDGRPVLALHSPEYALGLAAFLNQTLGVTLSYDLYHNLLKHCFNGDTANLYVPLPPTWNSGGCTQWIIDYSDYSLYTSTSGNASTLCNRPWADALAAAPIDTNTCMEMLMNVAWQNAMNEYTAYIDSVTKAFMASYSRHCMQVQEAYTLETHHNVYHYTLYYYDQAGNLVKTVPPKGVENPTGIMESGTLNTGVTSETSATYDADRDAGDEEAPVYSYETNYRYNNLEQPIVQSTPDGGTTHFWYDQHGRIVFSQNAKQAALSPAQMSYTLYDDQGRISEVGEISYNAIVDNLDYDGATSGATLPDLYTEAKSYILSVSRHEITRTWYDDYVTTGSITMPAGFTAENLRGRVAAVEYFPTSSAAVQSGTYYSYDIEGNVKSLIQYNALLVGTAQEFKRIDYQFDLASGKVNYVYYQQGLADQYIHHYNYDDDNKLIEVETGQNIHNLVSDARYTYYDHGPLGRTDLGQLDVQGVDYAYTVQGWLKMINGTALDAHTDMGHDQQPLSGGGRAADDVMSYNLHYFAGDYSPIGAAGGSFVNPEANYHSAGGGSWDVNSKNLYNGNIRGIMVGLSRINLDISGKAQPVACSYSYDQLNRYKTMDVYNGYTPYDPVTPAGNDWSGSAVMSSSGNNFWHEALAYDANGNITTLNRNDEAGGGLDQLTYSYTGGNNRLDEVSDAVSGSANPNDIESGQSGGNYTYDDIGNLTGDAQAGLKIYWNLYGKVRRVYNAVTGKVITFAYDPMGQRIYKSVKDSTTGDITATYYVRDAQGNMMSTYQQSTANILKWQEVDLYGSNRVGMYKPNVVIFDPGASGWDYSLSNLASAPAEYAGLVATIQHLNFGFKEYELTNHLGNVLATVSDKLILNGGGVYSADVLTQQDYYPFGSPMPNRSYTANAGYRYGFDGKEKDDEVKGDGDSYDFGARFYDSRLGRWGSPDKKEKTYTGISPFVFSLNNPISFLDSDGKEVIGSDGKPVTYTKDKGVITWSANATQDIKDVGNAMMTTDFGEKAFNQWQSAKTLVHIVINTELDEKQVDATAQTIPTKDDQNHDKMNDDGTYQEVNVVFYKKVIDLDRADGSGKRWEGSSYEEALGAMGTHEVYHNVKDQIALDAAQSDELKQDPNLNLPMNSEVNFRREYHQKNPGLKNDKTWEKKYKQYGYKGLPQ